jgi:hypothetical protein
MAVFFAGFSLLANVLLNNERITWFTILSYAIGGAVFGTLMTLFFARMNRRAGGTTVATKVRTALKSGRIPEGEDVTGWTASLEHQRRTAVLTRWLNPVFFGLMTILAVVLVVTGTSPAYLLLGLLFLAFAIWSPIASQRQLRRIAVLAPQLERQP